jgi:hypothetical protein
MVSHRRLFSWNMATLVVALTTIVYLDHAFLRSSDGLPRSVVEVETTTKELRPVKSTSRTPAALRPAESSLGAGGGGGCNCQTETLAIRWKDPCCRRIFVGVHKGGHLFLNQFRERFWPTVPSIFVRSNSTGTADMFRAVLPTTKTAASGDDDDNNDDPRLDYREVFVARDLYEMIVSGYLYHRSGRECWLDMYGRAQVNDNVLTDGTWLDQIHDGQWSSSWPDVNNRSLCHYLAQESEADGMLVYTNYAIERWYRPFYDLIESRRQAQAEQPDDDDGPMMMKSLFLDLQRLGDPTQEETLVREVRHFLAPNTAEANHHDTSSSTTKNNDTVVMMTHDHGHDTSHDGELRLRLTNHIRHVDAVVWDGWIAQRHQWPPPTATT